MITTDKDRNTLGNSWWFWCSSSILDAKFPEYCVALIKDVYHGNFKEGNSDILCPHRYYIYHLLYGFCICGENLCMTPLLGTLSLCQTTHQTWTLDWQPLQLVSDSNPDWQHLSPAVKHPLLHLFISDSSHHPDLPGSWLILIWSCWSSLLYLSQACTNMAHA